MTCLSGSPGTRRWPSCGDGVVAHGIEWVDGTVVLRWVTYPSTAVWDSIDAMLAVHGHVGATTVRWLD